MVQEVNIVLRAAVRSVEASWVVADVWLNVEAARHDQVVVWASGLLVVDMVLRAGGARLEEVG